MVNARLSSFILPVVLIGLISALYGFNIGHPSEPYYDEVYHVKTAREFIALSGNPDVHPPLGKLLISASILMFGDHPWVWRLMPCLFGIGCVWMFFLLARKFFEDDFFAFIAALFFGLDGLVMTQARIAMLNTPMLFFMLCSVWTFLRIKEKSTWARWIWLGVWLGLTAGTRWVGLGVIAVIILLSFQWGPHKNHLSPKKMLVCFLVLLLIYFATHLIIPFIKGSDWSGILKFQKHMWNYHAHLKAGHRYGSDWWTWPILIRPIWYYFNSKQGVVRGILSIGNPVLYWGYFLALGYLVYDWSHTRSRKTLFIILGFLSQLLPWAIIGRVKFFHYYYSCIPFVALGMTAYLRALWKTGDIGKGVAGLYFLSFLLMFAFWYPLYNGFPILEAFYKTHMWFKNWI